MRLPLFLLPAVAVLSLISGCRGNIEPDSAIALASSQKDVIVLAPEGDSESVRFSSAMEWHIELPGDAGWLEVSPFEGDAGMGRVSVKAGRNESGSDRSTVLSICSGNVTLPVTIEQAAFVATLELPETERSISAAGGAFSVMVNSDVDFQIDIADDWISFEETKAAAVSECVFRADANPSSDSRQTTISFVYGETARIFTVTQRPAGTEGDDWKNDRFVHRSLAMRFTADWCGYCPYMATAFESAKSMCDGAIELVSLHGGGSSLEFSSVSSLISRFGVQGFPTGIVDARANIPNYNSTATTAKVAMAVAEETVSSYPTVTGISCSSSLVGSTLDVSLEIYVKEPDTYRVTVLLLEDDIIAWQNGGGNSYEHDHVARLAVTSVSGEIFTVTDLDGEVWAKTFSARISSGWNPDNLRVLIYTERPYGSDIRAKGVEGAEYGDYGDTYVDNSRSVRVGETAQLELQ